MSVFKFYEQLKSQLLIKLKLKYIFFFFFFWGGGGGGGGIFLCLKHLGVVFIPLIDRIEHERFYYLQAGMDITLLHPYCVCK